MRGLYNYLHGRKLLLLLCFVALLVVIAFSGYCISFLFSSVQQRMAESNRGGATEILDSKGGLIAWHVDGHDSWRVPVKLEQVSEWVVKSIIAAEDQRFWEHCGVDPYALMRAVVQNLRYGRRVSGASTISMQAMRLLCPAERNWTAKLRESFQALHTEQDVGKEGILQLYLNLAPYGGNIIGIEAAARHYFGKSARELTLGEAALLSGIPQSPSRFNPRKHLTAALNRREYVLARMEQTGMVSSQDVKKALKEKIIIQDSAVNNRDPRFADYLLKLTKNKGGIVSTTIEPRLQLITQNLVKKKFKKLSAGGVTGMSVVVLDVEDSKLLAMVGNADSDNPVSGFVNGATAKRQPGSLLKPFIFCSAYELGILTPTSVVYDVPSSWREYQPENIDHNYMGAISAEESLRYSRNIPAVRVLQQIGVPYFADKLAKMELRTAGPIENYSLSLALGTAEMPLIKLVNAYAALARGGIFMPLSVIAGDNLNKSSRVFTPQSSWLTIQSMSHDQDCTLAWKTGTSWNHRDAWAICISKRYAVGVWCGNFSGSGNNNLLGAEAALPVAVELADSINSTDKQGWEKPAGIATRKVCAISGSIPSADCGHVIDAYYISGVSSQAVCRLHQPDNSIEHNTERIIWPAEVAMYLKNTEAEELSEPEGSLKLISPVSEGTYFIGDEKSGNKNKLNLSAVATAKNHISYFIDGEYVGRSKSGKVVEWSMVPGYHTLVAASEDKSLHTVFEIKSLED